MKTITSTLLTAQSAASRTPFVHMLFLSKDGNTNYDLSMDSAAFGNRILMIDHTEGDYDDYAYILLRDHDRTLPTDIRGYWTEIGYGDGGEYAGDGNNGGSRATSRLWVKSHSIISAPGKVWHLLELQGMWAKLKETLIRLGSNLPAYEYRYTGTTVYDIISAVLAEVGMSINALGSQDDSIISSYEPEFYVNDPFPFEDAGSILGRLIRMTKSFLRPDASMAFTIRYPQEDDSADLTVYSDKAPYFNSYRERKNVRMPNHIIVFCNAGVDELWTNIITGEATVQAGIDEYAEVYHIELAPEITNQTDATNRAAVYLSRGVADKLAGELEMPHHCAVELYDNVKIVDIRGS